MKTATISQTKDQLSALLDLVRAGETILIMDRQTPVARLEPVSMEDGGEEACLARLERAGLLRRPAGGSSKAFLKLPRPKVKRGWDILQILADERGDGR